MIRDRQNWPDRTCGWEEMVLWKSNNNDQKWPAPEGALAGSVAVFWDMNSVSCAVDVSHAR